MTLRANLHVLTLCLCPLPALAEGAMTAAEFEAYVSGRTLTYAEGGLVYGIEEYLSNRGVRWAYMGDECREGYWYEAGEDICFVYEGNPEPQCWRFSQANGRLIARFMGAENGRELYEAKQSEEPLRCLGPQVGV